MPFDLKEKRVFVAGETGLVGQALVKQLAAQQCRILSAPHSMLDLTDQAQTEEWFLKNKPFAVFMAAGRVGGILANSAMPADFISENLAMALNIVRAAHKSGVEKLLYLGTSCIYPRSCPQPIREEALLSGPLEQTNEAYAIAKIAGIKLCQSYRRQYHRDYICAMPTNLYGPHDCFDAQDSHVLPALMQKIHEAKLNHDPAVTLLGHGTALREFLYVDDLAEALILLLKNYSSEDMVNIGSGMEVSIRELASEIAKVVGYEGEIIFNGQGPDGTPRKRLECSKINALGWQAKTPLCQGVQKTYAWFLENIEEVARSTKGRAGK